MKVNLNRTMRKQLNEQVLEFNKDYIISVTAMLLWAVSVVFGCKKRKLRELFVMIVKLNRELEKRYRFDTADDEEWLYKKLLLRDLDVDIDAWWNEDKEKW